VKGPSEQMPTDPGVHEDAVAATPAHAGRTPRGLRRSPAPLRVKIELVVVSGAEGRYLRQKQDDAIRATLQWFAENRPRDAGLGR
jgi:hypothetical protein